MQAEKNCFSIIIFCNRAGVFIDADECLISGRFVYCWRGKAIADQRPYGFITIGVPSGTRRQIS